MDYPLHGAPALTFNGKEVIVAQCSCLVGRQGSIALAASSFVPGNAAYAYGAVVADSDGKRSGDRHQSFNRRPPSTTISLPMVQRDSSEAKYSTALATSCGVPKRPAGMLWMICSCICWR